MRRLVPWSVCALSLVVGLATATAQEEKRTVLLLLFDGWTPALVDDTSTPALDRMRAEGGWSHHLIPAFPSVSLVNQVSVSTGCWPARHGVVGNVFVDPERGRYNRSRDADWTETCEHLHEVAERQGVRSAALGWVGRLSTRRGNLATYVSEEREFADFPDDAERAEQVVALLRRPESERPRLVLAYFRGPDRTQHATGVDSEATRAAGRRSDAAVGEILDAIEELGLRERIAVLVTTDHGMLPVWMSLNIPRILRRNGIDAKVASSGATSFLYLRDPSQATEAMRRLRRYQQQFQLVPRDAQPAHWHLGHGDRVGDLIVAAYPPYFIEDTSSWPWWTRWLSRWGPDFLWMRPFVKAAHGYDPNTRGMAGILYAWGSGIARGHEVVNLRAVDIHPTVTRLLEIAPGSPVDGEVVADLLEHGAM